MNQVICIHRHLSKSSLLIEKNVIPYRFHYREDIKMYEIEVEWLGPDPIIYKGQKVNKVVPKKFIEKEQKEQGLIALSVTFQDEETFKKNWAPVRQIKLKKIMKKYETKN